MTYETFEEDQEEARSKGSRLDVRLPQRPRDAMHNHDFENVGRDDYAPVDIRYDGYSEKHPHYHVFRCMAEAPGTRLIKAAKGQVCTFRRFCGDLPAQWQTADGRRLFCEHHARKYNKGPCPYTRVYFCVERAGLNRGLPPSKWTHCVTCEDLFLSSVLSESLDELRKTVPLGEVRRLGYAFGARVPGA